MIETMYYKKNNDTNQMEIHVGFTQNTDLDDAEKRLGRFATITSIARGIHYFHVETKWSSQTIEELWKSIRRMKFKEIK